MCNLANSWLHTFLATLWQEFKFLRHFLIQGIPVSSLTNSRHRATVHTFLLFCLLCPGECSAGAKPLPGGKTVLSGDFKFIQCERALTPPHFSTDFDCPHVKIRVKHVNLTLYRVGRSPVTSPVYKSLPVDCAAG